MLAFGACQGTRHFIAAIVAGAASAPQYALAVLDALATALAWGLAGGTAALAGRLAVDALGARAERSSRRERMLVRLAERAITAVEALAVAATGELRPAASASTAANPPEPEPELRLLAEIEQAERAGRLEDAASMLDELADRIAGHPAIPAIRERLEAGRRAEAEGHLARIEAARKVNDTERVLELYRAAGSWLESPRRDELERGLARWFLDVIHRRLRLGRIQVDVVELATQVAETFGATVEGASLRASLPTLRRSVGLCPRCGQPYTGTAAACPRCLAGPQAPPPPDDEEPDDSLEPE